MLACDDESTSRSIQEKHSVSRGGNLEDHEQLRCVLLFLSVTLSPPFLPKVNNLFGIRGEMPALDFMYLSSGRKIGIFVCSALFGFWGVCNSQTGG